MFYHNKKVMNKVIFQYIGGNSRQEDGEIAVIRLRLYPIIVSRFTEKYTETNFRRNII